MATKYAQEHPQTLGHLIEVNSIEMYYETHGSGEPLVLLHGFGGCGKNWNPFIASLSQQYKLIIVDLRAMGIPQTVIMFSHITWQQLML
jgi:pimeloyl-ACP methyl ester carboxylesterase